MLLYIKKNESLQINLDIVKNHVVVDFVNIIYEMSVKSVSILEKGQRVEYPLLFLYHKYLIVRVSYQDHYSLLNLYQIEVAM